MNDELKITLSDIAHTDLPYYAYLIENRRESKDIHYHDFYQILYVTNGEIIHQHEQKETFLHEGDIFIIPPAFKHNVIFDDPDTNVLALYFTEELFMSQPTTNSTIQKFLTAIQLSSMTSISQEIRLKVHLNSYQQKSFTKLMTCLFEEMQEDIPEIYSAAKSIIDAMLLIVTRAYSQQSFGSDQLKKADENQKIVSIIIKYITENYHHDMTVESIAHQFAISKSTFNILFPSMTGKTFKTFIADIRIEKAKNLLQISTLSCEEVSSLVGYQDFSTFFRNFKKITGQSPSQYRRQSMQSH